jgi:hypothetical protein
MLVWQNRLNREYPFEFVRHEVWSEGRGRIRQKYHRGNVADSETAQAFQVLLAVKMAQKAQKLLREVGADVDVRIIDLTDDVEAGEEEYDVAVDDDVAIVDDDGEEYYTVHAAFEAIDDVEVEDTRWSLWRWGKRRGGRRVQQLAELPVLEVNVRVEFEGEDHYGN